MVRRYLNVVEVVNLWRILMDADGHGQDSDLPLDREERGDLADMGLITWVMSVRIDSLWDIRSISPSPASLK